jgi:FlaA1/EpsC-like NDP-sugar epimerase
MTERTLLDILVGDLLIAIVCVWFTRGLDAKGFETWPRIWRQAVSLYGVFVVLDVRRLVWRLDGASTLLAISGRNLIAITLIAVLSKVLDHEHRMTWRRMLLGYVVIGVVLVVVDVIFLRIRLR